MDYSILTLLQEKRILLKKKEVYEELYKDAQMLESDILEQAIKETHLKILQVENAVELILKSYDSE